MRRRRHALTLALGTLFVLASAAMAREAAVADRSLQSTRPLQFEVRSLDGSGNDPAHPDWGRAGTPYLRVARPGYADGIGAMVAGPPARYLSNRVFNDIGQNIFSENDVTQWGWLWGQFVDHTIGLRDEKPGESAPIPFDAHDPLERFRDDLGRIDFARTPAAPGTGKATPRQQINTVSSYIDAFAVYGGTNDRLEWLRNGPVNGTLSDNKASLLLPSDYLPRENARGDTASAPSMDLFGAQQGKPADAVVAGDVRANENVALTAVQTLFAREHNRIVGLLPSTLSEEERFQIARRVVGAEEQYVTYREFLPAMGVRLPAYRGYDPAVNASISNEFATVGFRAHSMIHGEIEPEAPAGTWSSAQLDAFRAQGIEVGEDGGSVKLTIPLDLAFGNPDLLQSVGLGPMLEGLANERQYKNDEQIDDSLRSVLFQVPKPGTSDPSVCGEPVVNPSCFSDVQDLAAVDVQRGRDHGMASYNQLRVAYGLPPKTSYSAITGESTESFPSDPEIDAANPIDDPSILDFTQLKDADGNPVEPGTDAAKDDVVTATRRTTLAARLKAIYGPGNVNKVDGFVGMLSEPHVPGSEFGELQLAIWRKQFQALRDGDRFFYLNDPSLARIRRQYGIDYRQTLASIIQMDSGVAVQADVFTAPSETSGLANATQPGLASISDRGAHPDRGRARDQRSTDARPLPGGDRRGAVSARGDVGGRRSPERRAGRRAQHGRARGDWRRARVRGRRRARASRRLRPDPRGARLRSEPDRPVRLLRR